jgi:16S rRNA (guanine966-N2)-methyltransferase
MFWEINMISKILKVLDLCAGTGNISFEFISREVDSVTCVDKDFNCIQFIRKTASDFGIEDQMNIIKSDIILYLKKTNETFDIIFADPPYDVKFHDQIAEIVFERNLLREDGVLIVEHGKHTSLEKIPQFDKLRPFGNVYFSFFSNREMETKLKIVE